MIKPRTSPLYSTLFFFVLAALTPEAAVVAAPGDVIGTVSLPNGGVGVSVAASCSGDTIYFTNHTAFGSEVLHFTDKTGAQIGQVNTVDTNGDPIELNELAWDCKRHALWAGVARTGPGDPVHVYMLDPVTGVATFKFNGPPESSVSGCCIVDGIAYDPSDDTVWLSPDQSRDVYHYSVTGLLLGQVTPKNSTGGALNGIAGIEVGKDGTLYVVKLTTQKIYKVAKATGNWIGELAGPFTFGEGLEIDPFSHAPTEVLWLRENAGLTAIELVSDSRDCCAPCFPKPIRDIPNLTSIDIFESTSQAPTQFTFNPNDAALLARIANPLGPTPNSDFVGVIDEYYDVFYSDADGTPNTSGSYLTFECRWDHDAPSGGGLNIAGVRLNIGGTQEWASDVASFVALGSTYIPGSENRALGNNLADDTTMGNTVGTSARLRLTLGFPSSSCGHLPIDSVPAIAPVILVLLSTSLAGMGYWWMRARKQPQ